MDRSPRYTIEFSNVQLGRAYSIVVEIGQVRQDFSKALKGFLSCPNCVRIDPVQLVEVSEAKYKVCKLSLTRHRFTEQSKSFEVIRGKFTSGLHKLILLVHFRVCRIVLAVDRLAILTGTKISDIAAPRVVVVL